MWSFPRANEWQETSNGPVTDVGSELPLTSFDVTHPGLTELLKLLVDTFWQLTWHPNIRETEWERETDYSF